MCLSFSRIWLNYSWSKESFEYFRLKCFGVGTLLETSEPCFIRSIGFYSNLIVLLSWLVSRWSGFNLGRPRCVLWVVECGMLNVAFLVSAKYFLFCVPNFGAKSTRDAGTANTFGSTLSVSWIDLSRWAKIVGEATTQLSSCFERIPAGDGTIGKSTIASRLIDCFVVPNADVDPGLDYCCWSVADKLYDCCASIISWTSLLKVSFSCADTLSRSRSECTRSSYSV